MSFIGSNILLFFTLFFVFCSNSQQPRLPSADTNQTKKEGLARLPVEVLVLVSDYLPIESFRQLRYTSRRMNVVLFECAEAAASLYAEYFCNGNPVIPKSVLDILKCVRESDEVKLTEHIIQVIRKLGTGVFVQKGPLPKIIAGYFKQIEPTTIERVCQPMVETGALSAAAIAHMKQRAWVLRAKKLSDSLSAAELSDPLSAKGAEKILEMASQYMTLAQAIAPGALPTPYIVATELELENPVNRTAINALCTANPAIVLVIDCGDKSHCGSNPYHLSHSCQAKHIALVGPNVTSIDARSFSCCRSLQSVDLSALSKLTHIGDRVLAGCIFLTSINWGASSKLTHIGDGVLAECIALTSVDLSALSQLIHIGDGVLARCYFLQFINLSAFGKRTSIGDKFLAKCLNLRTVLISPDAPPLIQRIPESGRRGQITIQYAARP